MSRARPVVPLALSLSLALLSATAAAQTAAEGRVELAQPAPERVVFHTVAGDLVFVLYPKAAPQTVEQFLKLVRAGVYDTTAIVRIEPGFVAQVSTAADRRVPFTPAQAALLRKLPAEFSALRHEAGVLSMAREDADKNSAETSFSILLGDAPHLDGKYTIFGRVEAGHGVLRELVQVPREGTRPTTRLEIRSAQVVPSEEALAQRKLEAPHPVLFAGAAAPLRPSARPGSRPTSGPGGSGAVPLAGGVGFIVLLGVASFLLQGRAPASVHMALNLAMVLVGAFLLMVLLLPAGQHRPLLAIFLFFGLLGVLKALGRFERAIEK